MTFHAGWTLASSTGPRLPRRLALTWVLTVALAAGACSKSAQKYLESGNRYAEQGRNQEAILEYRNALQKDPMLVDGRIKLGETYLKVGDGGRAMGEFVRAADLQPKNGDLQMRAGSLLLLAGRFDDAKSRAEKALALDAKRADAHVLHANALAGLKDFDAAIAQMQEALSIEGQSGYYANLGAMQLARGDNREAEQAFRKAIEVEPRSIPAQLAWANFLWATGRVPEADAALKTAYGFDPANAAVNNALATYYLAVGRRAEAEPYLRHLAESSKAAAPKLALANFYVAMSRRDDAVRVLESLAAEPRHWAVARAQIAAIRQGESKPAEAKAIVDEVLAKEPESRPALIVHARLDAAAGRLADAQKTLKAMVARDARDIEVQFLLGNVLAADRKFDDATRAYNEVLAINPRAAAAQVQLARIALLRGSPAASVQRAGEAVRNAPNDPTARLVLVRGLLAQRQLADAERELKPLVETFSAVPAVQVELGRLRFQQKALTEARAAFDKALSAAPDNLDAVSGLVAVDFAEQKPAAARLRAEAQLARAPKSTQVQTLAARVFLGLRDAKAAEGALRTAIELDPANLDAYGLLGRLYLSQGKPDQAVTEFEALGKRQERPVAAHTLIGMIRQAQGRTELAKAQYEQVLKIDPQAVVAANNLAWIYAESSTNLEVALQLAKTAKAAQPQLAEIDDTLGYVYLQKQQADLAIAPLQDAVTKDPGNPIYHYRLGLAYARSGQAANAKRELEQALKLKSDFSGADDARRVLSTLG
jgi:putative PEP-CTERM system TPR-repeat lipoprotein